MQVLLHATLRRQRSPDFCSSYTSPAGYPSTCDHNTLVLTVRAYYFWTFIRRWSVSFTVWADNLQCPLTSCFMKGSFETIDDLRT